MIGTSFLTPCFCTQTAALRKVALGVAALLALSVGQTAMAAPVAPADPATELGMVAHRALYDVKLLSAKNGSQIINISGKMYFEWKPSCEGWLTNHRFNLAYDYADSPPMEIGSEFSTYESYDGKALDYSSRRSRDGEMYEELRGKASLATKGHGKAQFTIPEDLSFDLSDGVVFPTAHTIALMKKAREGQKFFKVITFDGSDDKGPVEINAFIGKHFKAGEQSVLKRSSNFSPVSASAVDKSLLGPGWQVRMAFFPTLDPQAFADYELTMAFHESGVISDMVIEYGDFSVSQRLVALEKVKTDSCQAQGE